MSNYFQTLFANKVFFIAEIGGNFSDYETGIRLMNLAVMSGADAVKVQTYKAATLSSKEALFSSEGMKFTGDVSQYESFLKYQIDDEVQKKLFAYALAHNILFFSTPSHYSDCRVLEQLNCPIYKIGSDDLTNLPFLQEVAKLHKPIIISTGMSTLCEVKEATDIILSEGNSDLCLMHCVTNYPAEYEATNLLAIKTMAEELYPIPIGFSDHSQHEELVISAVALGARVIEKHFTHDKNAEGPDHPISLLPSEFKAMVEKVRKVESALGDGIKRPALSELVTRRNNRKSIIMAKSLKSGDVITSDCLSIKRPGFGIEPKHMVSIIGRVISKDIAEDEVLTWSHLNQCR